MTSGSGRGEITADEWISKSEKGELCGVLGCMHPPTTQCPKCRNHYCSGHLDLHVHKVADKDEANEIKNDEPLK
jgi:hypothetical protein